ncbi:unnamed protein product [marine sediment metagenome]|uniref:Uncharacterized protein n=1 Tax=marine sediment metagenome TaxID=412755 RepID=X0X7E4_9ZZZZ
MSEARVKQASEATAETECRHHWLIESPHGPTSMGICRLCGAQKEFRNWAYSWLWEDQPLSELSYGRWGLSREFRAPVSEA